jgi:Uma2 family endonuclease
LGRHQLLHVLRPGRRARKHGREICRLLIEVGDTSLTYDRGTKLRLYAESGIPEYWVVDASAEVVEIHRGPALGGYGEMRRLTGGAIVSPQAFPDMTLPLAEIFA